MKNVYEVLRQKEMELTRLEKEVEALRLVAPLLSEEKRERCGSGQERSTHGREWTAGAPDFCPGVSVDAGTAAGARSRLGRYRETLAVDLIRQM